MSLDVSLLLDGEVDPPSAAAPVLASIASDAALRDRLSRYVFIGDALRGNSTPDDGFTRRILERMHAERACVEPGFDPLAAA